MEPPRNLTMIVTGTTMLWGGWIGSNAGSVLAVNGAAAIVLMVTHLSASSAALTWMTIDWLKIGKPIVLGATAG